MEKVLYLVSADGAGGADELGARLRGPVADRLRELGAHGVQVNVADTDVAPAASLRIATSAAPADAAVGVWVDSAVAHLRTPFDTAISLGAEGASVAGYLVTESVPMVNERFPAEPGERTHGLAQLAFLQRPEGQSVEEWLRIWHDSHTQLAFDLQHTFAYVQNVVTRVLTPGATPWHAIVEECFPPAAMTDPHVFFDAVGDDERLARHQTQMFESVQRFIDLSKIEVIPTSRYLL